MGIWVCIFEKNKVLVHKDTKEMLGNAWARPEEIFEAGEVVEIDL